MMLFNSNSRGQTWNILRGVLGVGVLFFLLGASRVEAQCGNGVVDGGEGCDASAANCPGYENGSGGCNLYVDGNPLLGTCTTGNDCFFAFSCCKFNCNFVGSGAACDDDNSCTAGETCDQNGVCGAPGNIDSAATDALAGNACGDPTDTQCNNPDTCSGAVNQGAGDIGFCQDNFEPDTTICVGTNNGDLCDDDAADHCSGFDDTCIDEYRSAGFVCRADSGQCDVAELCDGASSSCPVDGFEPNTTPCIGASQGATCDADLNDRCSGVDTSCVDAFQPNTTPCVGASTGDQCDDDAADACSGTDASCIDGFQPNTTACTGGSQGGVCDDDTNDRCSGTDTTCNDAYQATSVTCRSSVSGCDVAEQCTGSSGSCPADAFEPNTTPCTGSSQGDLCDNDASDRCSGVDATCSDAYQASSYVCRSSVNGCDVAEQCTGTNGACPVDGFEPNTTPCTGSSQGDLCDDDASDRCSGVDTTCNDAFQANTFTCRASVSGCDVAELCTGANGVCPVDAFEPNTTPCTGTSQGNVCDDDPNDRCSGTDATCDDAYQANSVTCRPSVNGCDVAESCTGTAGTCPTDAFEPDTTPCTGASQGDVCDDDPNDRCSGVDASCSDGFLSNTVSCRVAVDVCDAEDFCSGSAGACPADAKQPSSFECRAGDTCDPAEFCDGTNDGCPADALATAGTVCRAGSGSAPGDDLECDPQEVCDGTNPTCPVDVVEPAGTVCNSGSGDPNTSGTVCDPEEVCDGVAGAACPSDTILPAGTTCRVGSGDLCDPDEQCSGVADQACGVDVYEPPTTVCRAGSGSPNGGIECDTTELCTGSPGVACPPDVIEPAGTLCRDQIGECDLAEECTGVNGEACPVDDFVPDDTACYTEPPIDHTPHQPLPSVTLPCDQGSCVCASGYCVAPETLILNKGKLSVDINYDKPNGTAQFRGIVFDNETDTVVALGDLRSQLLSNAAALRFSDDGDFDTTIALDNCVEKGKSIKCKGPAVKARFKQVSDTESIWEVQGKVKGLRVTATGYAPINDEMHVQVLQPNEFYQVVRSGSLNAVDHDCRLARAESLVKCKVQ